MPLDLITTEQVSAGKPMDTTLWGKVKAALDTLDAFIKTATGHTHDQSGTDQGGPVTPADGSVTGVKLANYTAGTVIAAQANTERTTAATSDTKLKEIRIPRSGTYRVVFDLHASGGYSAGGTIYKNGAAFGTYRGTSSGTYVSYSEDLTFTAGDLVQLYARTGNASAAAYVQNFQIKVADTFLGDVVTD